MNMVIFKTIQQLSRCKYFDSWQMVCIVDHWIRNYELVLSTKERNRLLKKCARALSRLGYRKHCGEEIRRNT